MRVRVRGPRVVRACVGLEHVQELWCFRAAVAVAATGTIRTSMAGLPPVAPSMRKKSTNGRRLPDCRYCAFYSPAPYHASSSCGSGAASTAACGAAGARAAAARGLLPSPLAGMAMQRMRAGTRTTEMRTGRQLPVVIVRSMFNPMTLKCKCGQACGGRRGCRIELCRPLELPGSFAGTRRVDLTEAR